MLDEWQAVGRWLFFSARWSPTSGQAGPEEEEEGRSAALRRDAVFCGFSLSWTEEQLLAQLQVCAYQALLPPWGSWAGAGMGGLGRCPCVMGPAAWPPSREAG